MAAESRQYRVYRAGNHAEPGRQPIHTKGQVYPDVLISNGELIDWKWMGSFDPMQLKVYAYLAKKAGMM